MKGVLAEIAQLNGTEMDIETAVVNTSSTKAESSSKKGGIFKKFKEKRHKKRSIIGPETSMSVSGIIESGAWRPESPVPATKDEKKSPKKGLSKEKLSTSKTPEATSGSRSESVSSRDEVTAVSPVGKESLPPQQGRERSLSQGNIRKAASSDGDDITHVNFTKMLSHSETFDSGTVTINPNTLTDQYVIHGPSSVDLLGIAEKSKTWKPLYNTFGGETHHETLRELREFLDTADETEPVDLNVLQDWDGWVIGSKNIR